MNVTAQELMDLIGVGYILGAYETAPWSCYEEERSITCNAEIRMNGDSNEVNAEIQLIYDDPPEGKMPMEQICLLSAKASSDGKWTVKHFLLFGEPLEDDIYNWEEKTCKFFGAAINELQQNTIPDFEELAEEYIHSKERLNDQYGGGGGKSPKVKPGALSGMKKGGGGF
jgi:hypothetical protein